MKAPAFAPELVLPPPTHRSGQSTHRFQDVIASDRSHRSAAAAGTPRAAAPSPDPVLDTGRGCIECIAQGWIIFERVWLGMWYYLSCPCLDTTDEELHSWGVRDAGGRATAHSTQRLPRPAPADSTWPELGRPGRAMGRV